MKHETKKISKIVDEILTYFLFHFNARAEITITPEPERYRMQFRFSDVPITDEAYAALDQRLVVKRQPELEDYYWQLTGEIEDSNELMLVAMMCDSIEMRRDGNDITLNLVRSI
ncbi:MAG: hypothetical protein EA403_11995 [Spirochaetaceae bacterium]|nr:MAG: hypothetical protein EA403_11995 [Spirochaetaceae bacterium]